MNCSSFNPSPVLQHAVIYFLTALVLLLLLEPYPSLSAPLPSENDPLISLHRSLCSIDSTTGREAAAAQWLASYLGSQNWTVDLQTVDAEKNRSNVYAYLGSSRKTSVLITSHLDTVPPFFNYTLFPNGTIHARGANDAKGSVASQIIAALELAQGGTIKEGDISLLFVVGEEEGGTGMKRANDLNLTWKSVIFGEPTENKLSRGHKGGLLMQLQSFGKAAHSAYPDRGIDANGNLIDAIDALRWHTTYPKDEDLGDTTVNFGLIRGGTVFNVISPYANATAFLRLVDSVNATRKVVDQALERFEKRGVKHTFALPIAFDPQRMDSDVEGFETDVQAYGTDAPNLKGSHKKYLYGPGSIHTAHSDGEMVTIADLQQAVGGYKKLIKASLAR